MAEVIVTFKIKGTHNKQIISKYFNIILKCNFCGVSFLFPSWETSRHTALSILTEPLSIVFFESHLCRSPGNDRSASSLQNASQAALFSSRKACTCTAYSVFTKYQTNGEMENKALMTVLFPRAVESFSHLAIQQWQMFIEQLLCKRPSLRPWDMPVNEQK